MKCLCQEPGCFNCGYKGILARVENGELKAFYERCDTCMKYKTDEEAKQALLRFMGENPKIFIQVNKKDIRKQYKELNKYLNQNSGHLELPRLKAFEHTLVLLKTIIDKF